MGVAPVRELTWGFRAVLLPGFVQESHFRVGQGFAFGHPFQLDFMVAAVADAWLPPPVGFAASWVVFRTRPGRPAVPEPFTLDL